MKDTFLSARLVEPNLIRMMLFTSSPMEKVNVLLSVDHAESFVLLPTRRSSMNGITLIDFRLKENLELGHSYYLSLSRFGGAPLDVSEATTFPAFDKEFTYEGDDLGYVYSKTSTKFALWAPLASNVLLQYRKSCDEQWAFALMRRTKKGVYRAEIPGDLALFEYQYLVTNSEVSRVVTDPYAKASAPNGEASVVVDFDALKTPLNIDKLPEFHNLTEAIIYEGHVRDLTIDPSTDIQEKGKFLGLIEKGRKTKQGHPAGFDYFVGLGFTHFQLLPIADYKTVDERNPKKRYNWGYDPQQYFVPEGSFASHVEDPLSRIVDFKKLVAAYHEAGIRIVQDVVFNHVYEYETSVFEKVVPNYYFRKKKDGKMTNCSGCGDDLATERPMVRKLILDVCKWWIDVYGIDGFRFDLMGLIDVETLQEIEKMAKAKRPDFVLYGEGWNMASIEKPLGNMDNASLLPGFGFFNDAFRENAKSYWAGNLAAQQGFKAGLSSMCLDFIYAKKFLDARQSVNYVECHDNETYYDALAERRPDISEMERLERAKGALASVLLSFGVPFVHAGEEILLSKNGLHNTYNAGDEANMFPYEKLDKNYSLVSYLRELIAFRKKISAFTTYAPEKLDNLIDILDVGEAVRVDFLDKKTIAPYERLSVYFNPSDNDIYLHAKESESVILSSVIEADSHTSTDWLLPRRGVLVLGK